MATLTVAPCEEHRFFSWIWSSRDVYETVKGLQPVQEVTARRTREFIRSPYVFVPVVAGNTDARLAELSVDDVDHFGPSRIADNLGSLAHYFEHWMSICKEVAAHGVNTTCHSGRAYLGGLKYADSPTPRTWKLTHAPSPCMTATKATLKPRWEYTGTASVAGTGRPVFRSFRVSRSHVGFDFNSERALLAAIQVRKEMLLYLIFNHLGR